MVHRFLLSFTPNLLGESTSKYLSIYFSILILSIYQAYLSPRLSCLFSCRLRTDTEYRQHFRRNDILLVDRGFRNVVRASQNSGFEVRIPPSVRGRAQLTLEQANKAGQCTLNRWPVEVVFAHLKDFKMISDIWYNKSLPSK